jgi:large subunit ribosomal protein L23
MAEKKKGKSKEEKRAAVKADKKAGKKDKSGKTKSTKDPWKVLRYPHLAEKSMNMVEFENKLTFVVKRSATKHEIKEAVESLFDVRVLKVQTEVTPKGVKKAYAKLSPDNNAGEIASRLGMV